MAQYPSPSHRPAERSLRPQILGGSDVAAASQNPTIGFRTASMVATVAVAIGMSAFAAHAFNATPANIIPVRQAALVKELPTVPVQPQYGKVVPFVSGTSAFIPARYGQPAQGQPDPLNPIPSTYGKVVPFVAVTSAFIPTRYGTPTPASQVGFRTSAYADYVFNATPANIIPVRQAVQVQPDPLKPIPPAYGRVVPFVAGTQAFIQTRSGVWTPTERVGLRTPAFGDYAFNATPAPVIPIRTRALSELAEVPRLVLPRVTPFPYGTVAPANPVIPILTRPLAELRNARFIATPAFSSPNVTEAVAAANPPINIRQQNPSLGVPGRLINSIYWNETLYYHYRPHLPIQVRRLEELRVEPRLVLPQVLPFPYWQAPPPANPVIPIQSRRLSELEDQRKLIVPSYYGFVFRNDSAVVPPVEDVWHGRRRPDEPKRKAWPLPPPHFPVETPVQELLVFGDTPKTEFTPKWVKVKKSKPRGTYRGLVYQPPVETPPPVVARVAVPIPTPVLSSEVDRDILLSQQARTARHRREEDIILALLMQDEL